VFSRFFIDRPIFASVLSIVITLAGGLAYFSLPLAQFPSVTPPTIQVDCKYPGASAQVVAETVAAPIEQQVNGVENMLYMASQCNNDGSYSLTITFKQGVNLNMAQVMVQNRVNLALPLLPDVVKQTGITTRKRSPDILQVVNIYSEENPETKQPYYDQLFLSNYTTLQIKDEIARLDGVGDLFMFGQRDYSMRIWIDPDLLAARGLTATDIVNALKEQNATVATGQAGQSQGTGRHPELQYTLAALGRLEDVEQFKKIVVKVGPEGQLVRLKDVARVELGANNVDLNVKVDGRPSVGLVTFQLPDANALETAARVVAKMEELKKNFPPNIDYQISYETTSYTEESITEVYKTLLEAVLLVAAVVLLFLQNWRAALIPLAAVPVAIVGTFAVMLAMGFSLNTLTLFGMVLAIGIVVDDAIVVVEAVEHHLEHGLPPRQAAIKAMDQVAGPVVAVGLVLSAVFVPCAFVPGLTGLFFRQFALTIASSTVISAFNSLTLSPALAALLLRTPHTDVGADAPAPGTQLAKRPDRVPRLAFALLAGWFGWEWLGQTFAEKALNGWKELGLATGWEHELRWAAGAAAVLLFAGGAWLLFGVFNAWFRVAIGLYTRSIGGLLRACLLVLLVYIGMLGVTGWGFNQLPRGFIPQQDMGYLMMSLQLPDAASDERTRDTMDKIQKIVLEEPGVLHSSAGTGMSFALGANGPNFGSMFVLLKTFDQRPTPDLSSDAITQHLNKRFAEEITDGQVVVFPPPPIRGVGRAGGFKFMVEDRGDVGWRVLQEQTEGLIGKTWKIDAEFKKYLAEKAAGQWPADKPPPSPPKVTGVFTVSRIDVPQFDVQVDRKEAMTMQVPLTEINNTLQVNLGSLYVNDFNRFGRTWQVIVQAEPKYRLEPSPIRRFQVHNTQRKMVQMGAVAKVELVQGPLVLYRYNMYPAVPINGGTAPGISSGTGIDAMRELALDEFIGTTTSYEWTEMAFLEEQAGNTAMKLFAFAVVMVFLVLAAQYESWSLPLAVILVVPMCLLSGVIGVWLAKKDINIFTQIGFVVLVGLASKNAILIVEFAKHQHEEGKSAFDATLAACKLRLRPIIMTSLAFILGVFPLLIAHGAGAEMRRNLGVAVFAGMVGVTVFGIFLTPVFYFVIARMGDALVLRSGRFQRANAWLLWGLHQMFNVLTLGLPWLFTRPLRPAVAVVPPSAEPHGNGAPLAPASDNGNGATTVVAVEHKAPGNGAAAAPEPPPSDNGHTVAPTGAPGEKAT
jgi:multidrug efflux pump subunit AcrB